MLQVGTAARKIQMETWPDVLERERQKAKPSSRNKTKGIQLVKAGKTARTSPESNSLLDGFKWQMKEDLRRRLVFPDLIHTKQRQDIVLWSVEDKKIIIIEPTVPWEEGCNEAHERKSSKYWELKEAIRFVAGRPGYFLLKWGAENFQPVLFGYCWKQCGNTRKRAVRECFILDNGIFKISRSGSPTARSEKRHHTLGPPTVGCHDYERPKHPVTVGNHLIMSWGVHPL